MNYQELIDFVKNKNGESYESIVWYITVSKNVTKKQLKLIKNIEGLEYDGSDTGFRKIKDGFKKMTDSNHFFRAEYCAFGGPDESKEFFKKIREEMKNIIETFTYSVTCKIKISFYNDVIFDENGNEIK